MRAEEQAQLEGEAVHVDAVHLLLWETGGLGQSGRFPARKVRGAGVGARARVLSCCLTPPLNKTKLIFIKTLLCSRPGRMLPHVSYQ